MKKRIKTVGHDKHAYVVGYHDDWGCVYGRPKGKLTQWCDPMTMMQAERYIKELESETSKAIYKLVPVKVFHP